MVGRCFIVSDLCKNKRYGKEKFIGLSPQLLAVNGGMTGNFHSVDKISTGGNRFSGGFALSLQKTNVMKGVKGKKGVDEHPQPIVEAAMRAAALQQLPYMWHDAISSRGSSGLDPLAASANHHPSSTSGSIWNTPLMAAVEQFSRRQRSPYAVDSTSVTAPLGLPNMFAGGGAKDGDEGNPTVPVDMSALERYDNWYTPVLPTLIQSPDNTQYIKSEEKGIRPFAGYVVDDGEMLKMQDREGNRYNFVLPEVTVAGLRNPMERAKRDAALEKARKEEEARKAVERSDLSTPMGIFMAAYGLAPIALETAFSAPGVVRQIPGVLRQTPRWIWEGAKQVATPGSSFWMSPLTQTTLAGTLGSTAVDKASELLTGHSWGENVAGLVDRATGSNLSSSPWGIMAADMTNPGWLTPYGLVERVATKAGQYAGRAYNAGRTWLNDYRLPLGTKEYTGLSQINGSSNDSMAVASLQSDIRPNLPPGLKAAKASRKAEEDISKMNEYHKTNVEEFNTVTGSNVRSQPFRTDITGSRIRVLPDEEFNRVVEELKTNSPNGNARNIGGAYHRKTDTTYLRTSGNPSTAYHEFLHRGDYGITNPEVTRWRIEQLVDHEKIAGLSPEKKAYYLSETEFPVHLRQQGESMGIEVGDPFPGEEAFDEMLFNNRRSGASTYVKGMDPGASLEDKQLAWKALNGTAFQETTGLGVQGTAWNMDDANMLSDWARYFFTEDVVPRLSANRMSLEGTRLTENSPFLGRFALDDMPSPTARGMTEPIIKGEGETAHTVTMNINDLSSLEDKVGGLIHEMREDMLNFHKGFYNEDIQTLMMTEKTFRGELEAALERGDYASAQKYQIVLDRINKLHEMAVAEGLITDALTYEENQIINAAYRSPKSPKVKGSEKINEKVSENTRFRAEVSRRHGGVVRDKLDDVIDKMSDDEVLDILSTGDSYGVDYRQFIEENPAQKAEMVRNVKRAWKKVGMFVGGTVITGTAMGNSYERLLNNSSSQQ